MNTRLALLIVLSSLLLAGCGNKGPLVQAPREAAEVPADDSDAPPAHDEPDADTVESEDGNQAPVADPSIEPVQPTEIP